MIEAIPTGLLAPHYRLHAGAGAWTELWFDDHGGDASFHLDGRSYRAAREVPGGSPWRAAVRAMRGRQLYRLEEEGAVIARVRGGGLRPRFHVWTGSGAEYRLREDGKLVQMIHEGTVTGRAGRRGALKRGVWAEFAGTVPAPVQVFVVWLLLCRWETLHSAGDA